MRSQTKKVLLVLSVCTLSCLFVQPTTAKSNPPPTSGNPGPVGALHTLGATPGLQDKSPMSATLGNLNVSGTINRLSQPDRNRFNFNLRDLIAPLPRRAARLPPTNLLKLNHENLNDLIKILHEVISQVKPHVRPENLFYVEVQTLVSSTDVTQGTPPVTSRHTSSSTYYVPGALLSNGRLGLDIGGQAYLGPQDGYGITLRKDILCKHLEYVRQAYAYNDFVYSAEALAAELTAIAPFLENKGGSYTIDQALSDNPLSNLSRERLDNTATHYNLNLTRAEDIEKAEQAESLAAQFVHISTYLQASLVYGYRAFHASGDLQFSGISLARLTSLHPTQRSTTGVRTSSSDGLQFLLNVQGLFFSPVSSSGYHSQSALRTGIALIWQDQIPYVRQAEDVLGIDGNSIKSFEAIGRWNLQAGLEYRFRNVLEGHDLIGGFVRYRFLPDNCGDKTKNKRHLLDNVELTASAGKGTDDRFYFGLSIGKSFY